MRVVVIVALVAVLGSGCGKDVHAVFPAPPEPASGTVVLLLSSAASGVTVSINGQLVVEDAHTARVVISNVPVGTQEIVMTANGADKAMRVWVGSEHATTIPLGVPDATPGLLKTIFGTLVSIAAYSLLN